MCALRTARHALFATGGFFVALLVLRVIILGTISVLAYLSLILPEEAWKPLNYLSLEPTREAVTIDADGRTLTADIYRPDSVLPAGRDRPAVLVFTPLLQRATKDPRVVNFATTIARLGFVVLVPERPPEDRTFISPKDPSDARAAWHYLRRLPEVDDDRVAVFGMSYGLGPVFVAAAQDAEMRERIPLMAGLGGYGDLAEVMRYALTGDFSYGEVRGHVEPDAWVYALAVENVERAIPSGPARDALLAAESEEEFRKAYAMLPEESRERIRAFSPTAVADRIHAPILLIHSTDDLAVPYTESLRLRDHATASKRVIVALINAFRHGDFYELNAESLRERYLPSLGASLGFLYAFFSHSSF